MYHLPFMADGVSCFGLSYLFISSAFTAAGSSTQFRLTLDSSPSYCGFPSAEIRGLGHRAQHSGLISEDDLASFGLFGIAYSSSCPE